MNNILFTDFWLFQSLIHLFWYYSSAFFGIKDKIKFIAFYSVLLSFFWEYCRFWEYYQREGCYLLSCTNPWNVGFCSSTRVYVNSRKQSLRRELMTLASEVSVLEAVASFCCESWMMQTYMSRHDKLSSTEWVDHTFQQTCQFICSIAEGETGGMYWCGWY